MFGVHATRERRSVRHLAGYQPVVKVPLERRGADAQKLEVMGSPTTRPWWALEDLGSRRFRLKLSLRPQMHFYHGLLCQDHFRVPATK